MNPKFIMYLVIITSFLLIGAVGVYFGLREFRKRKENNEYTYKTSELEFVMYHVTWCPYCKQALPIWDEVAEKYNVRESNSGKNIIFKKVDCTDSEKDNVVNGKVVDSFPTIYVNNFKDPQTEFVSKCTYKALDKFVKDTIAEN